LAATQENDKKEKVDSEWTAYSRLPGRINSIPFM
jgi:hypothetical protein